MKILYITTGNHPGTLGGIQTVGRNLKEIYGKDFYFLTNKFDVKKFYSVSDVIEIYSSNKILRAINKILKNKIRKYLTIKEIKKLNPDICILSASEELELISKLNIKKISIQHTIIDRYLSETSKEEYEKILKYPPNYFICLSDKDKIKMERDLKKTEIKFKTIRFLNTLNLLEGKKEKNKNLIIVSRLSNSAKRLDLAIRAMKKLPEFTLNIYGEGEDKNFYKEIIEREKLKNVFLKGGTNQIKEKLDNSSIYIITSDFEGYPVSSIEAMRRGLPIIIRDTFGAASDIVVDNTNGILLNKEWNEDKFVEAIKNIYDNYEYYSENSRKLGERYNKEIIKKEWDGLFKELVDVGEK